jgi:choice-of-anchor C domain-containing protein
MRRLLPFAASVLALAALASPALATTSQPNAVSDGGFETPADSPDSTPYPNGSSLGPWTVSGPGGVDHVTGSNLWVPSEGNQTVDLNGNDRGAISQTIATTSGTRYQLHFALAGNFYGGPAVKTFQASFGTFTADKSFDTSQSTVGAPGWTCPTIPVKAAGTATPLSFVSTTVNPAGLSAFGPVLDDVRVMPADAATVIKPERPTIGQGARKFMLVVRGTNFEPGYRIFTSNIHLTLGTTTFVNEHTLEVPVTVPADEPTGQAFDVGVAGGVAVTDSDTCGKSLSISPAPAPTSASPNTEAQGSPLTTTVHGTGFQPGAVVAFGGGITVLSHSFDTATGDLHVSLRISPSARVGSRTITVRNPDGGVGYCPGCLIVQPN